MKKEDFEVIPKLEGMSRPVVTVVFSTDDNYAAPAGVAIQSVLNTISADVFCDVVVLDNSVSEENRKRLKALGEPEKSAVRLCDVSHIAEDAPVHSQFTKATYQRLFIPFLFRTHEKVLYLDSDILIRKDVSELFETQFANECVAAASDVGISEQVCRRARIRFKGRRINWPRYAERHLGVADGDSKNLINSGLLLFNIAACAKDDFSVMSDLDRHVHFGYFHHDQCVATRLFCGRIKHLHLRWNLPAQHQGRPRPIGWLDCEYNEAARDPAMVHFTTQVKPWRKFHLQYEDEFWAVARQTVWFSELSEQRLSESFLRWLRSSDPVPQATCSQEPMFSIIMPVYNRESMVACSLKSIQLQDFTDFEIIVIDDASTDRTVKVVQELAQRDARIKLIQMESNVGPGVARNVGMAQVHGKYIRICDSDDFYPPGVLSMFARRVANEAVDLVVGNQLQWLSRKKRAKWERGPARIDRDVVSGNLMDLPELWTLLPFSRCLFRRKFLEENRIEYPTIRRGEDPTYVVDVITKARSFILIKDPVYLFHARPRDLEFSYDEIRDAYTSHDLIHRKMINAGFEEIAYLFTCFHSPFILSHAKVTEEESLKLSAQLIDIAKQVPPEALDHPHLKHPFLDLTGLTHDLLVTQNSTPEQVAELMKRKMFCGLEHLRRKELNWANRELEKGRRILRRLRVFVGALKFVKWVLFGMSAIYRRSRNRIRRFLREQQQARVDAWRAQQGSPE